MIFWHEKNHFEKVRPGKYHVEINFRDVQGFADSLTDATREAVSLNWPVLIQKMGGRGSSHPALKYGYLLRIMISVQKWPLQFILTKKIWGQTAHFQSKDRPLSLTFILSQIFRLLQSDEDAKGYFDISCCSMYCCSVSWFGCWSFWQGTMSPTWRFFVTFLTLELPPNHKMCDFWHLTAYLWHFNGILLTSD